jgi:TolA-binding protein
MDRYILQTFLVLAIAGTTSCVTMGKYHGLKDRVTSLEERTGVNEEHLDTLTTRQDNLRNLQTTEDKDIRTTLAELGADLSELQMTLGMLQGRQEEVQFKLNAIAKHVKGLKGLVEDRFGIDADALPAQLPDNPEEFYKLGNDAIKDGLTRRGRAIFKSFLQRFPQDDKADDAQFMIAETLFTEGRFTEAVNAYKTVYDQYQSGDRYTKAVLRIGLCYVRSNKCDKALKIYKFAKRTFKGSPTAEAAEKEITKLKDVCK